VQGGGGGGERVDEFSVEVEVDEAAVLAIADEEEGLVAAQVDGEAVAGLDLPSPGRAGEGLLVLLSLSYLWMSEVP